MFPSRSTYRIIVIYIVYQFYVIEGTILQTQEQFQMIDEESILINVLQKYYDAESTRLNELEMFGNELIRNTESFASEDDLAWNPLAIYRTVKQLTEDFEDTKKKMTRNSYEDVVSKILQEENIILLNKNHTYMAIRDLIHLRKAQNLKVIDLMEGRLAQDLTVENTLTPEDCLHIGKISAENHDHKTAVHWLQECEDRFDEVLQDQARKILISSALFIGDESLSRESVWKFLEQGSNDPTLLDLSLNLGSKLGNWRRVKEKDELTSYKICAGDYSNKPVHENLRCRYNHHNSQFLTIAPLKEEMLSTAPKISVFREAIYDSEIEQLKSDSDGMFRPGVIDLSRGSKHLFQKKVFDLYYRTCHEAYLDNRSPTYATLWNRLQDISSFSMERSLTFQLIHYAPGGYLRVHQDYTDRTPSTESILKLRGNKIGTALMYLNDVTAGGNTVFPQVRVNAQPIKGSILFWINMKPDGQVDMAATHAACPVIYGEKLACSLWFRSRAQDHWVAEPLDDVKATRYSPINPNTMCYERKHARPAS